MRSFDYIFAMRNSMATKKELQLKRDIRVYKIF